MRVLAPILIVCLVAAACGAEAPRTSYTVAVTFNEQYEPAAGDQLRAILRSYDPDAELSVTDGPGPVARAVVSTRRQDICEDLLRRLVARDDVANLDCQADGDN